MKISNQQKEENRQAIIQAAVDLIIEKGFKGATMRAMAREAGLADATIYNYFPTKDAILFAYYQAKAAETLAGFNKVPDIGSYNFQEQLQLYFETGLESFLGDREFLQETFRSVFFAVAPRYQDLKPIQEEFFKGLSGIFDRAMEAGEIEEQIFQELTTRFFWDYYLGIVMYWLGDRSEQFTDTTDLIDKTMDLACAVIKAGLVNKMIDIASFLFKNHVLSHLQSFKGNLDAFGRLREVFMERVNEPRNTRE